MAEGQEVKKAIGSVFKQLKYEHLVAGISGGVLSTLVLHPLDLLKIRFQGTGVITACKLVDQVELFVERCCHHARS